MSNARGRGIPKGLAKLPAATLKATQGSPIAGYEVRCGTTGVLQGYVFNYARGGRWSVFVMAPGVPRPVPARKTWSTRHESAAAVRRHHKALWTGVDTTQGDHAKV